MKTMSLYDLTAEWLEIEDLLIENGGELTAELEERLAAVQGGIEERTDAICAVVQRLTRAAEAAKAEADRLTALARSRQNSADRLKRYLLDRLTDIGREKVETNRFVVRVQQNGRPSIAWELDPELLPAELQRVTVALDGTAAYERWKRGEPLPPGMEVTVGRHLRIR